jgi:hypothetical protein
VIDRAETGGGAMDLRFRTPGHLKLDGEIATAVVGSTKLTIAPIMKTGGTVALGAPTAKDCYKEKDVPKGQCDAARFPVTDYRVRIPGPHPAAIHVISLTDAKTDSAAKRLKLDGGWQGIAVSGPRDAVVVWGGNGGYVAPANAMHVILDAPEGGTLKATRDGNNCKVTIDGNAKTLGKPLVAMVDANCALQVDPEAAAASAVGTKARRAPPAARSPRSGCCGAEAAPGQSFAMALVVIGIVLRRRQLVRLRRQVG